MNNNQQQKMQKLCLPQYCPNTSWPYPKNLRKNSTQVSTDRLSQINM